MRMADFGTGLIIGQLECSLARASKLTCTHLLCFNLGPSLCSSFFDYCNCPHCLLFRDILKFHILPPSQSMSLRQWSKLSSWHARGLSLASVWTSFSRRASLDCLDSRVWRRSWRQRRRRRRRRRRRIQPWKINGARRCRVGAFLCDRIMSKGALYLHQGGHLQACVFKLLLRYI